MALDEVEKREDEEVAITDASGYRFHMLRTFSHILDAEMASFLKRERSADAEKEIFKILINTALTISAIEEKVIQNELFVDGSTISRWKHGLSVPSRPKQLKILSLIIENIRDAIISAERQMKEVNLKLITYDENKTPTQVVQM